MPRSSAKCWSGRRRCNTRASTTRFPIAGRDQPDSESRCAASPTATRASRSTRPRLRRAGYGSPARSPTATCRFSCRRNGPTRSSALPSKAGRSADLADFDNAPYVRISMGDDLAKCRDALRPHLALYIGGMGARSRNFYNDLTRRIGYEAAAATIQDLYLDGKKNEAAAAVPDALIDEISLIGPPARIRDRLQAWREIAKKNWIGSLMLAGADIATMRVVAEAVL